ncbi:hypothetical protein [Micromonospora chersina]|uniref:hypothetical protein n=1 Tax=Micromonospora chersina TaxID=47854 RepID=UPI00370FAD15
MSSPDPAGDLLIRVGRLCREQSEDLRAALADVLATTAPADAPASRDLRALLASVRTDDRQQLWGRVGQAWLHLAVHVADHVQALAVLLAGARSWVPVYAHASLARSAVESAATAIGLLADGQQFEARLGRGVALLLRDAREAVKAANDIPGNAYMASPKVVVEAERDRLLALVERARIEVVRNSPGGRLKGVRVVAGGREELLSVQSADLVERTFGDLPAAYRLLSGVVHGLPWGLADNASISGREARWEPEPVAAANSALVAVTAAERVVGAFARYRGFGEHALVARMHVRTRSCDEAMVKYGRAHGALAGARPTVARFLSP